ncbi:MAG: type II secretion system F family protein [Phycisphaera sp.]|nr:MAG: type II secretion system F family protein [Phycisphaera sp.]
MTRFRYQAKLANSGQKQSGELTAESPAAARFILRQAEMIVLDIRPVRERANRAESTSGKLLDGWLRSRRSSQKAELLESLATLIESGVSVRKAIEIAGKGSRVPKKVRSLITRLTDELSEGTALHDACAGHGGWFDELEIAVIRVAQQSGELAPAMRRLAERQSRSSELRDKIIAALTYPILIGVVTALVVVLLSTKTLPPIVEMLRSSDVEVPALTRALVTAGHAFSSPISIVIAAITLAAIGFFYAVLNIKSSVRTAPAWYARSLPAVCHRLPVSALARDLADLIASGVPMAQAVEILEPTLRGPGTSRLRASLTSARAAMAEGARLEDAFDDEMWFDAEFRRLLAVGQESGELPSMLRRLANRYEQRSRRAIDRLASLLEPAAILVMSAVVGTVVLGAVLPLIRMQELIS